MNKRRKNIAVHDVVSGFEVGAMRARRIDEPEETCAAEGIEIWKVIVHLVRAPLQRTADDVAASVEVDPASYHRGPNAVLVGGAKTHLDGSDRQRRAYGKEVSHVRRR